MPESSGTMLFRTFVILNELSLVKFFVLSLLEAVEIQLKGDVIMQKYAVSYTAYSNHVRLRHTEMGLNDAY